MSEKESRKFHLKIIAIIVVGSSVIFGIIFFRRVKIFIRNEKNAKEVFQKNFLDKKGINSPLHKDEVKKVQVDKSKEGPIAAIKKELDHRPLQNRHPVTPRIQRKDVILVPLETPLKRALSGKKKRRQREVENIVAVSSKYANQFQKDEIYASNLGRVFVKKDAANGLESERVAYNTRTGALGVITGKLVVKFRDEQSFGRRGSLLKEYLQEDYSSRFEEESAFEVNYTGIFTFGDLSMSELERLCQVLEKQGSTIKSCKIEVLDHAPGVM